MDFPEFLRVDLLGGGDHSPVPGKIKRVKRQRLQQQHLLLLHAHKCQQREARSPVDGKAWQCQLARCKKMKRILNHMMSCPYEKKCGCSESRQLMQRLTNCKKEDCPVCVQKKGWQMSITAEQRSHIVDLLVQASTSDVVCDNAFTQETLLLDTKMTESNMYNMSNTLSEYYRMLAAQKWEIEMDIERRQRLTTNQHRMGRTITVRNQLNGLPEFNRFW